MFPIYPAAVFENIKLTGGTTTPLIFSVDTGEGLEPYVVKIFSKKHRDQYNPLAKECFAHALATEFPLKVADAAIIHFDRDFISSIPENVSKRILESGQHFHFGTKYEKDFQIFNNNLRINDLEFYQIETLFAFDLLIYNTDRRKTKPNLLINGRDCLLIDHELSLAVTKSFLQKAKDSDFSFIWSNPALHQHLCLPYLSKQALKGKLEFGTFNEHLKMLDASALDKVEEFLKSIDCSDNNFTLIKSYIWTVKSRQTAFLKSLYNFF